MGRRETGPCGQRSGDACSEVYRVLKPGGIVSVTDEFLGPDYPLRKTTAA